MTHVTADAVVQSLTHWPIRRLSFPAERDAAIDPGLEWIVTNGIGGYASATVAGGLTRRYHGLLVSAHPPPRGRLVSISALRLSLLIGERRVLLDHEDLSVLDQASIGALREFRLEGGMPCWRYEIDHMVFEKRVMMPAGRNSTYILLRRLDTETPVGPLRLECEPVLSVRMVEGSVHSGLGPPSHVAIDGRRATLEYGSLAPPVHVVSIGESDQWSCQQCTTVAIEYDVERRRGYDAHGQLFAPCRGLFDFHDHTIGIMVSTDETAIDRSLIDQAWTEERHRRVAVLEAAVPRDPFEAELALAADHFIFVPIGHGADAATGRPADATSRSIIAGYHWFTDWGRDTMISLEGLTLLTGRWEDAGRILALFARHVRDGLIPNLFPEGQRLGLYHTADATLWFFEAIARYLRHTGNFAFVSSLLPVLKEILAAHRRGTVFGIKVDPGDGLLRQGEDGYALTWMDARMGDWVVTPRRGKAVEINALWFNALCHTADWFARIEDEAAADECRRDAEKARVAFNQRFWNPRTGCLFDVVDGDAGDDPACRPNQLFAISLPHAVLDRKHWDGVLACVRSKLCTPLGLRTLAPDDPAYRSQYIGNLAERDGAYHQGTVWPWLTGAYVDALLRADPDGYQTAREFLSQFPAHLDHAGVGSISEICDAAEPHLPRGCIAQAWSVAEILRAWRLAHADVRA